MSPGKARDRGSRSGAVSFVMLIALIRPFLWPTDRKDLRVLLVLSFAVIIFGKLLTIAVPFFYKWSVSGLNLYDGLQARGAGWTFWGTATPLILVGAFGIARFLSQVMNNLRDALFIPIRCHVNASLSHLAFEHLHNLGLAFHRDRRASATSRSIERGKLSADAILRVGVGVAIPAAIELILTVVALYVEFDLKYSMIVAGTILFYIWFSIALSGKRMTHRKVMMEADLNASIKLGESLLNYEPIKYFGMETYELHKYDSANKTLGGSTIRLDISLALLQIGQTLILSIGTIVVALLSAAEVVHGTKSIGHYVLVNAFMMQITVPLMFIGTIYREITTGLVDFDAFVQFLQQPRSISDAPSATALSVVAGSLKFEDVSFSYDGERKILHGLTFEIEAGQVVGLVGESGAGKSTISKLIFRLYDPDDGRILIDGQDIRLITQASLRMALGIVPQDNVLFNESLAYNIAYGTQTANQGEIARACEVSRLSALVESLPNGLQTVVGDRGTKLSGGEKQRVAIARILLKNPPILILDEATSALDNHTEAEIQESFQSAAAHRTTLVIAHRLSTVQNADKILVLKEGRVAESGKHDELMRLNGIYASLWRRQKREKH